MSKQQSDMIKFIAMVTMVIDHIGVILFPELEWLRIIGRISFPLFAVQIGIGFRHTRSIRLYFRRLLYAGIVIQAGLALVVLAFGVEESIGMLNIFFTLALGVATIYFYEIRSYLLVVMTVLVPFFCAEIGIFFDYGCYGVTLILFLYIVQTEPMRLLGMTTLAFMAVYLGDLTSIQLYSVLAVPLMYRPAPLSFRIPSVVFYWFYPVHLVVLYVVGFLLG